MLDFNPVWGDETTISFYRVSVPFQIFNYPRGQVFAHVCLNQGVDIGVQAHPLLFGILLNLLFLTFTDNKVYPVIGFSFHLFLLAALVLPPI